MRRCRLCRSPHLNFVTDFGRLAMTSQFVASGDAPPFRQSILWKQCDSCGVVQLAEVPPIEQIRPRFSWMSYKEPDGHLGASAQDLIRVGGFQPHHRVFGLSHEERPLLERLGLSEVNILDPVVDLDISLDQFGRETIQENWTVERARRAAERYGPADAFIALYSLEHAHDAAEFLDASRAFLAPDGILLVEVPDCARAFRNLDLTVIWEEHALYFTEETLHRGLARAGFNPLHFRRVPGGIEDQLVWIGRPNPTSPISIEHDVSPPDVMDVQYFAQTWTERRDAYRAWADAIKQSGAKLAVFGAGHRACTLIDVTGISEFVDCVIDDSPEKQQFRFPAGTLEVRGSAALVDHAITHCLLVVNPEVEERIVNNHSEFISRGGTFVSCYPRSSRALRLP